MDVVQTIESAAHSAVEAVEHPFLTIGHRLSAIGAHISAFLGHPYAAPPLQDALTMLHSVVTDLAQEVAELRVPCPCRPASTAATLQASSDRLAETPQYAASSNAASGDAGQATGAGGDAGSGDAVPQTVSDADMADFRAWQKAKADAASFTGQA